MVGKYRGVVQISLLQALLFAVEILLDWPLDKFKILNEHYYINRIYYCIFESHFYVEVKAND